ncbi:hypothetical protein A8G00_14095 [Sphingobium sp. SA916]|nr:hypothetical protein A8G00_14095 [Sphingobium sp. SA916]
MPALAGSTYTLAADLLLTASSGVVYVDMIFMNDANTILLDAPQTNAPAGTDFSTADTNRKLYKCTATAPAGTTKVACRFVVSGVMGLTVAAVRRMKLELGDKATSYSADASAFTAYTTAYSASGQVASLTSTVSTLNGTVSSQATSISTLTSGLSSLTNTVTASSNPNLLQNGGFENQILGWTPEGTATGGWFSTIWAWGRYARNTTAWAGGAGTYGILRSTAVPCQAGVVFTAAADADILANAAGAVAYIQLMWTTSSGLAYTDGPNRAVGTHSIAFDDTGASRALFKVTGTAPANTTAVAVRLVVSAPSGVTISEMNWRQAKLEKGSIATPYSGEASAVQMFQAYSDLNTSFATVSSTVSSQGSSISSLQTAMTTANGNIATLTNTLNASSSPNLMDNGGFENGLTGWVSNVSGWNIANNGTWGTYAYRQGDFTGTAYMFKDVSGITAGGVYTITCDPNVYMTSGTYSLNWQIQWLNSSNAIISSLDGPSITGAGLGFRNDGVNRAAIKTTGTAPAGTVLARFVLYFNKLSGTMAEIDMRQVKLELGTIATPFSSEASIKSVYTVANTATSSLATLTTTVNTQGSSITTLQSAMSTAQGDVATLKQKVTTGSGNLLPNSSFAAAGWPAGWDWYSPFPGSYTEGPARDLAGNDWRPGGNFGNGWGEHTWGLRQTNGNSGDWGQLHCQRVPVQGSKWYSFELIQACHRATAGVKIEWYDASNNYISVSDAGYIAVGTGGTNINNWTNRYIKGQAPSNAAFAVCVAYKSGTNTSLDSYMWICRPMLREVDANYVGPSAYTPSGDRASIETIQSSVNGVLAKYGVTLDVNNYITGFQQLNNGATGSFIINADYFAIVKPGGGVRTEYSVGNWRAYDGSGVLRARWGVW